MSKLQTSIFACVFAVIGIFLTSDCDLFLYLALPPPENAFQGKVVWITGASSGIGASLALEIVKSGGEVIISARREDLLDEVAKNCSYFGKEPMVLPLDVTNYENQKKAYDKIINKYGKIDSLVLNAGRSQRAPALDTDIHDTEDLMKLNYFSFVSLARTVVPAMVSHGGGQVVVVSSVSGKFGTPVGSSYSGTKFALHGYFDALRSELAKDKVSVSMVCPGPVESEIAKHTVRDPSLPVQPEGKKMATDRCTKLMVKGMYYKVAEMWIAEQPILLLTYISIYMPWVGRQLWSFLGPKRVQALKEGGDLFDVKGLIK